MTRSPYGYFAADDTGDDDGIWGWDPTERVGVCLEPDGSVREVVIADDWRSQIAVDELGRWIAASYNSAEATRADLHRADETTSSRPELVSVDDARNVPVALLLEVFAVQSDYAESYVEALREPREFRDERGYVTVAAWGSSLGSITLEEQWLTAHSGSHVAAVLVEPMNKAIHSGADVAREMDRRFPAIAEFRQLTTPVSATSRRS
ncbi:hypothetical protein [Microbacterium hydrothermale]|uniref:hypothetical protein n=1 Tax=Microbacterium hydrothermale TaxID=857427 RepID=UPI0010A91966|nr:hypothetical protein [Microbacterium hydrothermale]